MFHQLDFRLDVYVVSHLFSKTCEITAISKQSLQVAHMPTKTDQNAVKNISNEITRRYLQIKVERLPYMEEKSIVSQV